MSDTNVLEKFDLSIQTPKSYVAVIYNDNVTPYDLVFMMLINVFHKTENHAAELTEETHNHGKAVVMKSSYNYICEKVKEARTYMSTSGYPNFKIEVEEE